MDYIINVVRNKPTLRSRISEDDVKALVGALVADNVLL